MGLSPTIEQRRQNCERDLASRGNLHLLKWWDQLDAQHKAGLLAEIEAIPWTLLDTIIPTHVLKKPRESANQALEPARVYRRADAASDPAGSELARAEGVRLLSSGGVAAMTVAGGQGTRLGIDGPKGLVPVTPVAHSTLFEHFAQMVLAARRRYQSAIPWYIMTSPANHDPTVKYFQANRFFGLPESDVVFFSQGMLPAFDFQGRVLMADKHRLALAPDGHGGSLKALVQSGSLADMQKRGVSVISYFQIDNPLVKPFDSLFIGLHARTGSEMSTKVTPKAHDLEKVGNVCLQDGKLTVIEYSDFPESLVQSKDAQGRRRFDSGNLAIHLLDVGFVERIISKSFQMPFRRAEKVVPYLDEHGVLQQPAKPNAVKLETFIFDVLPLASNPLVLEVDRAEEFSPVKNASGSDSLETSQRDQVARACRWLEAAGFRIPKNTDGEPAIRVDISPLFALDVEELAAKRSLIPELKPGADVRLE